MTSVIPVQHSTDWANEPTGIWYRLPVGLLAQLVEHCTSIVEVMDSNPVQAFNFFQVLFSTTSLVVSLPLRIS